MREVEPLIAVGDVIALEPGDYLLGTGPVQYADPPIRLRVVHLPDGADVYTGEWLALLGVELHADGSDGRHGAFTVRTAALPRYRGPRRYWARGAK